MDFLLKIHHLIILTTSYANTKELQCKYAKVFTPLIHSIHSIFFKLAIESHGKQP